MSLREEIIETYEIEESDLDEYEILGAWFTYEDYEGSGFVLLKRNGILYEVNSGHCSCYGHEGQFDPEITSKEALLKRDFEYFYNDCQEIKEVIKSL